MSKIKPLLDVNTIKLIKKIKSSRLARNMTQAELSEKANITQSYLAYIEKFERNPSLETINKISIALEEPSILDFMKQSVRQREHNRSINKLPVADYLPLSKEDVIWLNTTQEKTVYLPASTYKLINKFKDELYYAYFMSDDSLSPEINNNSLIIIQYVDIDPYNEEDYQKLLSLNGSFVAVVMNGSAYAFIRKIIISDYGNLADRKDRHPILFQAVNSYNYYSFKINQNEERGFTQFKINPLSDQSCDVQIMDIKGFDAFVIIGVVLFVIDEIQVGNILI
ncbi:MAG: helix-turn-helix domain-containing protein [bacterium]